MSNQNNPEKLRNDILFSLLKAGEHNLYQFRKILYISKKIDNQDLIFQNSFPNAEVFTIQQKIDFLNNAKPNQTCFDLIIIFETEFPQLDLILQKFKCRYIIFIDPNPVLYSNFLKLFNRFEISFEIAIYKNKERFYDVFMPIGPNDYEIAQESIKNKYEFLSGLRELYYCAKKNLNLEAIFIDESKFPFSQKDLINVRNVPEKKMNSLGGFYAQLKQFYFQEAEKGSLDYYLAICTDVFFLKNLEVFTKKNIPIYSYGAGPTYRPSNLHMARLHPQLRCFDARSAVSHQMLFDRRIIKRLLHDTKQYTGKEFWFSFIEQIDEEFFEATGASDYDLYFNYLRLLGHEIFLKEPSYIDTGDPKIVKNFNGDYYVNHHYTRGWKNE